MGGPSAVRFPGTRGVFKNARKTDGQPFAGAATAAR
jgi:hypothetical protein